MTLWLLLASKASAYVQKHAYKSSNKCLNESDPANLLASFAAKLIKEVGLADSSILEQMYLVYANAR